MERSFAWRTCGGTFSATASYVDFESVKDPRRNEKEGFGLGAKEGGGGGEKISRSRMESGKTKIQKNTSNKREKAREKMGIEKVLTPKTTPD